MLTVNCKFEMPFASGAETFVKATPLAALRLPPVEATARLSNATTSAIKEPRSTMYYLRECTTERPVLRGRTLRVSGYRPASSHGSALVHLRLAENRLAGSYMSTAPYP